MARKAVNGYPEKSFYDNTVFGGIVATGDPLNEGSFAFMSNLDIADTGRSVKPRVGFVSTTLSVNNTTQLLSNKILYFRDPQLQKDIIIDLQEFGSQRWLYKTDLSEVDETSRKINAETIGSVIDFDDLLALITTKLPTLTGSSSEKISYVFRNSTILTGPKMKMVLDTDGVTNFIAKLKFRVNQNTFSYVLKVYYREKGYLGFTNDTIVLSYVDHEVQTTNLLNRNVASRKSIVLDPVRLVKGEDQNDVGDLILGSVNLLKDLNEDKYINNVIPQTLKQTPNKIKIEPMFHLPKASSIFLGANEPDWAYRFDIINSSGDSSLASYKTPWRFLRNPNSTNSVVSEIFLDDDSSNDIVYTYYVTSVSPDKWLLNKTNVTSIPSIVEVESLIYHQLRLNGTLGSQGTSLGNLIGAQMTAEAIENNLKSLNIDNTKEFDTFLLDALDIRFLPEDSVVPNLHTSDGGIIEQTSRSIKLTNTAANYLNNSATIKYPCTTDSLKSPFLSFTEAQYNKVIKLKASEMLTHMTSKIAKNRGKIRFVILPYTVSTAGTINTVGFTRITLLSVPGIYTSGLNTYYTLTVSSISEHSKVRELETLPDVKGQLFINAEYLPTGFRNLGNTTLQDLIDQGVRPEAFQNSVSLVMYIKAINKEMRDDLAGANISKKLTAFKAWDASSYMIGTQYIWGNDYVYLQEYDEQNPDIVENAENLITFNDRTVTWSGNKVYISEDGDQGYYTASMLKEFPEEVMKVIVFKNILLVFCSQNLYAIYEAERDVATGVTKEDGSPEYVKEFLWLQQPVLYNLNPDKKYLDVIQVFNQMVLFYSNEGQLYMIKPSTTIDSQTQFSVQYFNKSANDILANYTSYMNQRLRTYGRVKAEDEDLIKEEDVEIRCLLDIDVISIFYSVPGVMTMILRYDVIGNRYTVYDTLSFSKINEVLHIEGGEAYFTQEGSNIYITKPIASRGITEDNADYHYIRQFRKEPVFAYIDSGNLNLNNHIMKRTRDLVVVLKNINAGKILYNAELVLDDMVIRPFYAPDFKVRMTNGPTSTMTVDKVPVDDINELFGMDQTLGVDGDRKDINSYYLHHDAEFFENNSLLRTETLNSNKLIEYNSSILGMGKVIRIRLQFISKGSYKIQSFGIVYKERRL